MGYVDIVSEDRFLQVAYAMLILASVFVLVRAGGQAWMRKPLEPPDYCLYFAYVFYLAMSICYIIIMPQIYRLGEVMYGKILPSPTLAQDVVLYVRMMFITTTLFWGTLWFVKLSFLALYKNLMTGLPKIYMGMWWAVSIFCIVSLMGCIFSYLTSCAHFAATIHGEVCSGDRSLRGELASLYLAYALDVVLSDILDVIDASWLNEYDFYRKSKWKL